MKKITYSIVLLWSVLFCSCQKEDTLTTVPEGGVQLNFSGAQANLSAEELSNIVETFHVLIYDETGNFVRHSEYENLKSVSPVKLPIGQYTFAYLSNIKSDLISGIQEDKKLEDITLSLEESEGNVLSAGSIFKGIDTLTVGKDSKSNAALQRLVGRMDIELKGIGNDVTVKSVALTGSPEKIRFNGEAEGESVKLNIPMAKKQDGVYVGQAITFPTTDSVASLEFVLESNEGVKTFDIPLKNKVEANKIHTIHAISNLTGGIWNITFDMETTPWGATVSEDVTADEAPLQDTVCLHFTFTDEINIGSIRDISLLLENKKSGYRIPFYLPGLSSDKDTLLITQYFSDAAYVSSGEYIINEFICLDSLGMRLYDIRMCNPQTLIIDENGTDFSGGERQKLSIARGLYKDAPMVIMDEPTAALDALAEAEIYESFSNLVEGKTAVYISHRLASTRFCDKIALFDHDGLKEYGTHEELMERHGSYYEMFTVQGKYYQEEAETV